MMFRSPLHKFAHGATAVALSASIAAVAHAAAPPYPDRAPLNQYMMADAADEIALARSAVPASISADAEVLTLGDAGYRSAVRGKNGFVCLVQRAWASPFTDAEFWNPKERTPICFNPAAARSVLPSYLERTRWALDGASRAEIEARIRAEVAAGRFERPAVGAMAIMLSKRSYLSDSVGGHWHPHLMFFLPSGAGDPAAWGANLPSSPVLGAKGDIEPVVVLFVPVPKWSDGTPDGDGAASAQAMAMAPNPR